jgi:hypothetical protein
LIQNAEDNSYTKAKKKNDVPFVSFKVYSNRIVIDSNEDRFTDENVWAICNIGKSSKTGAQGYIGEKGIGFKSVFMVASRAHIRSGPFSFYFQHNRGDSGIGMVNPVWLEPDPDEEFEDPITRITLTLHDCSEPHKLAEQRKVIHQQFNDLPKTLLLFLKKLKRIEDMIYYENGLLSSSTAYSSQYNEEYKRAILSKHYRLGDVVKREMDHYFVTKLNIYGLAKNENRTYTEAEEERKSYATAEVVLAFPVNVMAEPVVEYQDVFAFLPIRKFGFKVY